MVTEKPASDLPLRADPKAGFLHVYPTPSIETLRDLYRHEFYQRDKPVYLEKVEREIAYWRAWWTLRLDLMAAETGAPGTLLDIGAGGGFFLDTARSQGWQVKGIEPSVSSVAYARERFKLELANVYLKEFVTEERFDAIHLSLVLEHVPDPHDFVSRVVSLLKPGGVIWVEVPNDFNVFQEVIVSSMEKPRWWIVPRHHLNYFNYDSLSALLGLYNLEERHRLGSFPMEMLAMMGIDYIGDDAKGAEAHAMRMAFERKMLEHDPCALLRLYQQLAAANLGRTCNLLARYIDEKQASGSQA